MNHDTPTTLYRLYDEGGDLLYVGISTRPLQRVREHSKGQTWWTEVASQTFQHYPTRTEAAAAELAAIKSENPKHNIVGRSTAPVRHLSNVGQRVYARRADRRAGPARFFCHDRWGQDRTSDELHLVWEIDYAAVSDDYLQGADDPHDVFDVWLRAIEGKYGAWVPIYWFIDGFNTFESAPFQHHQLADHDFLSFFTWPEDIDGNPVNWLTLPQDYAKSWFFAQATGWQPAPYQPSANVAVLRMAAQAERGYKTRRAPLRGDEWGVGRSAA